MASKYSAKEMRAIGEYAKLHDLIPGLSVYAEKIIYFRKRGTDQEVSVGLQTILKELETASDKSKRA